MVYNYFGEFLEIDLDISGKMYIIKLRYPAKSQKMLVFF